MRRRTVVAAGVTTAGAAALGWWASPYDVGQGDEVERLGWHRPGEDDAVLINRRLRSAQDGDEVRLPYSTRGYFLGSTLRIPRGVSLRCHSDSPIRARVDLRSMVIFQGPRARLIGANLETGSCKVTSMVLIKSSASQAFVEECHLHGGDETLIGVQAHGARVGTTVTDCVISGPATGVSLVGSGRGVLISGTEISEWSQRGVYVQQRGGAPLVDVTVRDSSVQAMRNGGESRYPIVVTGTERQKTRNLVIRGNTVAGADRSYRDPDFPGTADQIAVRHAKTVEVSENTSTGGGDVGITVAHCHDGEVRDNVVSNNDTAGIYVGTRGVFSMGSVLVEGNRCENNGQNRNHDRRRHGRAGIRVAEGGRVTLRSNTIADTQARQTQLSGVTFDGSPTVKLEGNSFRGMATDVLRAKT